jgi:acetyl esterase/lipase
VTIIGTWNDTTDAVERAQASVGEISRQFDGDLDVSVGGLQSQGAGETWAEAAQGKYLDRWTEIVKNLATARRGAKGVTYVRFAHEMNGDWYDWKVAAKDADDFKKAWRMFHDLLKKEFPAAQLVFCANSASHNGVGIDQIWPGDDLVDVVGVDFYDGWPRFDDQATWDQHYNDHELGNSPVGIGAWLEFAKAHHKGLSFPEWGLNPAAGNTDNPFFIKAMHDFFAKHAAGSGDPSGRVLYDVYFNCEVDGFKITSGQNSSAAKTYRSLTWGGTGPASGAAASSSGQEAGNQNMGSQNTGSQNGQISWTGQGSGTVTTAVIGPRGVTADPEKKAGIAYATASPSEQLDLFLPRRAGAAVPLVIDIHGGAFSSGDKSDGDVTANVQALLSQGYAVASLNYRLSAEARFPAGVQDVKAAIRWLRAHAGDYGIDPTRFAVWGTSAGGYLADMVGATGRSSSPFDDPRLGNAGVSSAVQAVVSLFGPTDFRTMDEQLRQVGNCSGQAHDDPASPESTWLGAPVSSASNADAASVVRWVKSAPSGSLPPYLFGHGKADCTVPPGQSVELADALRAQGGRPQLQLVDGAGHGADQLVHGMLDTAIAFVSQSFASAASSSAAGVPTMTTLSSGQPTASAATPTPSPVVQTQTPTQTPTQAPTQAPTQSQTATPQPVPSVTSSGS